MAFDNIFFKQRPAVVPQIYGYKVPGVPSHNGFIKVGYTGRPDVNIRIGEQVGTVGVNYELVLTESAMRPDGSCFLDTDVHDVLKRKGFPQLNPNKPRDEWFKCTVADVKAAIIAVRDGTENIENRHLDFGMRPEQYRAVERTMDYFKRSLEDSPNDIPKFLWNAKMRFGKTFAAYQLAKKMGLKRVLVLTFKPAVESAWREDLMTHVDFEGWQFVSNKDAHNNNLNIDEQFANADKSRPIVVFGSFQDLLGTNENGGIKAKNEFIHTENWDLVIFDEYHYGAWRENAASLFEKANDEDVDFDQEQYSKSEAGNAYNESFLPITTRYYLFLSGTPFRALNSGEFIEEQIFNWTYSDEQRAKAEWKGSNNPYESLPRMVMLTYKMPDDIRQIAMQGEFDEFDLNEFFSAKPKKKGDIESSRFVYENEVQKWLDLIRGAYLPAGLDDLKLGMDKRPPMPFSDTRLLNVLTHTLWFLPNVASCYAMANLLKQRQNRFYHDYTVNICAGTRAGIGLDALRPVQASMGNPLETKTITLSCGKLTTGVTVKPWAGVFMLRNLKSPETYFQTAFRVQSPWTVKNDDGSTEIMKQECYVFDFALDRALRQVADYSCRLDAKESNPEKKVEEFIGFLPVLAYDGSSMKQVSAQDILDITLAGTSATLLARRWQSALLVNVDNATLKRLMDNPEAMKALENIEAFRNLYNDIETIINKSDAVKKKKEKGGKLTPKEKKEISEAEKEYKSMRKQIQEKLIKFSTRIPAFMYLTDYRERSLKDVILQLEPDLFKKVTGLSTKDFDLLCSLGLFNSNMMNDAIFKFKRYEDASLSYTGLDMNADHIVVGGWDTVIRREEYEKMYASQQDSMIVKIGKGIKPDKDIKETAKPDVQVNKAPVAKTSIVNKPGYVTRKQPIAKVADNEEQELFVKAGDIVIHKKFGRGVVKKIDKFNKHIEIKFGTASKKFIYPDILKMGLLTLEGK